MEMDGKALDAAAIQQIINDRKLQMEKQNKGNDRKRKREERNDCHICQGKGHYPEECAEKMKKEEFKKRAQEESWCYICLKKRREDGDHSYLTCSYFKYLNTAKRSTEDMKEILCQEHLEAPPHSKLYCRKNEGPPRIPREDKQTQTDSQEQLEKRTKEVLGKMIEEKRKVKRKERMIVSKKSSDMKRRRRIEAKSYSDNNLGKYASFNILTIDNIWKIIITK